jgi:hypothetical protein
MIEALARIAQTGLDIFRFEIREFSQNLGGRKPGCQQLQDVNDTNTHPAHAGLPATLFGVDSYALSEFRHGDKDTTAGLCGLTCWLSLRSDLGN